MFWMVAGTTLAFLVLFSLLTVNDDPVAERERRRLEQEERIKNSAVDTRVMTKREQLKALMGNANFVFLLVITLFVGYGKRLI